MGLIIDLIIIVLFAIEIVWGYRSGLVIKLGRLFVFFPACIVAHFIASMLKTSMGQAVIKPLINENTEDFRMFSESIKIGTGDIADEISYYILFIVFFIVALIVLNRLVLVLKIVDYIPIIGKINKIGGAIVGFIICFIIVYLITNILFGIIPESSFNQIGLTKGVIEKTYILKFFIKS